MDSRKQNIELRADMPEAKKHQADRPQNGGSKQNSEAAESYAVLRWQDEPPTKPGYYWYANPRHAKTILRLFEFKGGLYVETRDGVFSNPGAYDGEWAGPISEPVDEAEN